MANNKRIVYGDYFLAVSRLHAEKRMDLIAESFIGSNKKIVLVGDGPQKNKISKIVAQNDNMTLYVDIDDKKLSELYKNCRATIYVPVEEDFGLVPIEGMVFGKPCIAANEGGCKETVLDNVTGFLIDPSTRTIKEKVNFITDKWLLQHRSSCITQAAKFSLQNFINEWVKILDESAK